MISSAMIIIFIFCLDVTFPRYVVDCWQCRAYRLAGPFLSYRERRKSSSNLAYSGQADKKYEDRHANAGYFQEQPKLND